ncbi:hypothetical protein FH972_004892 [Carpinus fangiana]|uniref:J domain-containing protein n=1 Tax=Carpinus fangiana TaxID=176857 RepID=A0A5N6QQG3_9ROSI|nr:hypothetical protein FH972_004892 [Carpinus fangiana]
MQGDEARALLGFTPDSRPTFSQVKAAYRMKAWESHPDLFPAQEKPHAESKFKLISEAYSCLLSGARGEASASVSLVNSPPCISSILVSHKCTSCQNWSSKDTGKKRKSCFDSNPFPFYYSGNSCTRGIECFKVINSLNSEDETHRMVGWNKQLIPARTGQGLGLGYEPPAVFGLVISTSTNPIGSMLNHIGQVVYRRLEK